MQVHVVPIDDIQEHERSSACACRPKVEFFDNGNAFICHDAFDGREQIERDTGTTTGLRWAVEEVERKPA